MIIPLFGTRYELTRPQEAIATLKTLDLKNPKGDFQRVEAVIDYNHGDSIRATVQNKLLLADFLHRLNNESGGSRWFGFNSSQWVMEPFQDHLYRIFRRKFTKNQIRKLGYPYHYQQPDLDSRSWRNRKLCYLK